MFPLCNVSYYGPDVVMVYSVKDFYAPDVPVGGDQTLEHQQVVGRERMSVKHKSFKSYVKLYNIISNLFLFLVKMQNNKCQNKRGS